MSKKNDYKRAEVPDSAIVAKLLPGGLKGALFLPNSKLSV